ncbi:MAG: hypothetical protein HUU10_03380 [Bacteroidetes bacterium]|nr:hypothetical protein [Bacteroidota bacterium]
MQKLFLLICLLSGLNLQTASAQSAAPDSMFLWGNQDYSAGRYSEAVNRYLSLLNEGFESSAMYLNLGNSWFRLQQYGLARWAYEKAAQSDPWSADIQQNLNLVRLIQTDKITKLPQVTLRDQALSALSFFRYPMVAIPVILLSILALILFFLRFHQRWSGWKQNAVLVLVWVTIFIQLAATSYLYLENLEDHGFITAAQSDIKSEPNTRSATLFQLHHITRVFMISRFGEWVHIRLENGNTGWIPLKEVAFLSDTLPPQVAINEGSE